jgi:hypothetical protein
MRLHGLSRLKTGYPMNHFKLRRHHQHCRQTLDLQILQQFLMLIGIDKHSHEIL